MTEPVVQTNITITDVARMCHEANRALCVAQGDYSQPTWELAPDWQRQSACEGVVKLIQDPDATPAEMHEAWCASKRADGWHYGPVKDPAKKTHPCLVGFSDLPPLQQAKDHCFSAIVTAMKPNIWPAQVASVVSSRVL